MREHDVVIAGAGPAGMMLAAELALAGIDVALVERRPDHQLIGSRAGGIHARTIEVLDQRGVVDRFMAEGKPAQAVMFADILLDMSHFPSRHPYALGIWQNQIEAVMAAWVAELPVEILYASEVTGFTEEADRVTVTLADGRSLGARYLVGCDGGRSRIRKAAGIGFPGLEATRSTLIAEVEMTEETPKGTRRDAVGIHGLHRLSEPDGTVRAIVTEAELHAGREDPGLDELRAALVAVWGTDFGAHSPTWISRFTDSTRQADRYRAGRVLLCGDACHIHYPAGGQGISLGIQDAVNLGWKLARVLKAGARDRLLDTYEAERRPVATLALRHTLASVALLRPDERSQALFATVAELVGTDQGRDRIAGLVSGLAIHYDLGDGHPLLGRRMPDLELVSEEGPRPLFSYLHRAEALVVNLGVRGALAASGIRVVDARYDGAWTLPVVGDVAAPTGVLVRPDGYVAWVGEDGSDAGLADATERWCLTP